MLLPHTFAVAAAGHTVCNPYCKFDYFIKTPCIIRIKCGDALKPAVVCDDVPTTWSGVLRDSLFDVIGTPFTDWRPPAGKPYSGDGYSLYCSLKNQTPVTINGIVCSATIEIGIPTLHIGAVVNDHVGHGKRSGATIATRADLDAVDWAHFAKDVKLGLSYRAVQLRLEQESRLKTDIQSVKNRIAKARLEAAVSDHNEWQTNLTAGDAFTMDDFDKLMENDALNPEKVVVALIEEGVSGQGGDGIKKKLVKFPGNDSNWYELPGVALDEATNHTVTIAVRVWAPSVIVWLNHIFARTHHVVV